MNRKNGQLIYRTKRHIHDVIHELLLSHIVGTNRLNDRDQRMYESLQKALENIDNID